MPRRKKARWSYNTGERGRNWVRAYCRGCEGGSCARADEHTGTLYLEWMEVEVDPTTGTTVQRRHYERLQDAHTSEEAKRRADKLAAAFSVMEVERDRSASITLGRLIDLYVQEVTPTKDSSTQNQHPRARRLWKAFFDAQPEAERRCSRHPSTLDRTDWERFIAARRAGRIPGAKRRVGDRQVQYDLAFMIALLNWATGRKETGRVILAVNPWAGSIRRAQEWENPKEKNPRRVAMTDELRDGLVKHSPNWQFTAALYLERETRRRNNSIRQLRWSDIELEARTARWRGELDKNGREYVTPLTARAVDVLRGLPSRGIGEALVFPSPEDAMKPTTRGTFQTWLQRAKRAWLAATEDEAERAKLKERLFRVGYHAEKRAGVRDPSFRRMSPKAQEQLAGTNFDTLRRIYDEIPLEEVRQEMAEAGLATG